MNSAKARPGRAKLTIARHQGSGGSHNADTGKMREKIVPRSGTSILQLSLEDFDDIEDIECLN